MSIKGQRGPVRAALTRGTDELTAELDKETPDAGQIRIFIGRISRHHQKLLELDHRMEQKLLQDEAADEAFQEEYETVTTYVDKFHDVVDRARQFLAESEEEGERRSIVVSDAASISGNRNKYRLPKLELRKFGGDPKEWIAFWSQFKTIHEDEDLRAEDKFQYLIQSTKENSTARSVVCSFPPSKENYPKAVDYLKERFGRDEILVEVYVRELLCLVIHNTQKKTSSLSTVYDKLETQLRALESLGVTSDKYAAMLYPLVESSLPEEILRTWERSRASLNKSDNLLAALMSFIRTEVDGEERIRMAKIGFANEKKNGNLKTMSDIPTATDLYHGDKKELCIFCEKPHKSVDCFKLPGMKYEDKIQAVKNKRACFVCLKTGHVSMNCRLKMKCPLCGKRHSAALCSKLDDKKDLPAEKKEGTTSLSNFGQGQIGLQTILVKLENKGEVKVVRALFDSGCQHTYVSRTLADALQLEHVNQVEMVHSLFGGQETRKIKHNVYHVVVNSVVSSAKFAMKVLDQPIICGTVERLKKGSWMSELRQNGIEVSDIGKENPDIHLLFGADIIGHLYTGKIFKTEAGPVALQTIFGWTVTGVTCRDNQVSHSTTLLSMSLLSSVSMENLWRLEILGIRDPIEVKSQEVMEEKAMKQFQNSVKVDESGRYEVALPWTENHVPVADNLELSKKRLSKVVQKLKSTEKLELYNKIFMEWMELGIIEEVPDEERENNGSYMPHRPHFSPHSTTTPVRPVFDASAKSKGLPSLNECLHKGPNLIESIPAIFTRFRLRKYGVTSDIKKAFFK